MRATGWQAHSVRGFISGQLGKRLGLRVHSIERDGERAITLRLQHRGQRTQVRASGNAALMLRDTLLTVQARLGGEARGGGK